MAGIFNMLESFFIFSLAIMFILVCLLLFHIRGKLNANEQRIDTLYEITTKITNEISATRVYIANLKYAYGNETYENEIKHNINNIIPFQPTGHSISVKKIIVSDDELETDNESDNNSDDDDINSINYTDNNTDLDDNDIISINDIDNNNTDLNDNLEEEQNIINNFFFKMGGGEKMFNTTTTEENKMNNTEVIEENSNENEETKINNTEIIEENSNENEETKINNTEVHHEDYNKINLPSLKKIAIEKGLSSNHDIYKMKKNEIINLLNATTL